MWRFVGFRFLQAVPVILAVITVTFFLVRVAPGPFRQREGGDTGG